MRKRIKRPTLAKQSNLERAMQATYGTHSDSAVMYAPTGGQASKTAATSLTGIMVRPGEKLPAKLPKNTNTKGVHGGISTRPYLKEGLGQ